jgi:hypothetical protein
MRCDIFADPEGGPYLDSFERSQKAAAHDLKGATAFLQYASTAGAEGLVVALQALIDFAGYRLQAMLILPLETHVVGSGDACDTLPKAEVEACGKFKIVADHLGLAEHEIKVGEETVRLHFGADVEGHQGSDGKKIYVLDTART